MKPIPVVFHIGPLQVHTYGIGLALTFWFGYTYFERRLRKHGYPTDWFLPVFLWIILAAVVGARAFHVLSNLSYYSHNPGRRPRRLARRAVVVRGPALRRADRHRPHPPALPRTGTRARPRSRRAGAHGLLGHGPAPRAAADGGRGRPSHPPVVRHVLRRPGGPAPARADLPGHGGLRRVPGPPGHRATAESLARPLAALGLPAGHRARHGDGALGHGTKPRRAPLAR